MYILFYHNFTLFLSIISTIDNSLVVLINDSHLNKAFLWVSEFSYLEIPLFFSRARFQSLNPISIKSFSVLKWRQTKQNTLSLLIEYSNQNRLLYQFLLKDLKSFFIFIFGKVIIVCEGESNLLIDISITLSLELKLRSYFEVLMSLVCYE